MYAPVVGEYFYLYWVIKIEKAPNILLLVTLLGIFALVGTKPFKKEPSKLEAKIICPKKCFDLYFTSPNLELFM